MRASENFPISGNDEIIIKNIPIDKTRSQESKGYILFVLSNNEISSYIHTRNADIKIKNSCDATIVYSSRVVYNRLKIFSIG